MAVLNYQRGSSLYILCMADFPVGNILRARERTTTSADSGVLQALCKDYVREDQLLKALRLRYILEWSIDSGQKYATIISLIACARKPNPGIWYISSLGIPLKLCQASSLYPGNNYPKLWDSQVTRAPILTDIRRQTPAKNPLLFKHVETISGWRLQPLWNILVNWYDYSP